MTDRELEITDVTHDRADKQWRVDIGPVSVFTKRIRKTEVGFELYKDGELSAFIYNDEIHPGMSVELGMIAENTNY